MASAEHDPLDALRARIRSTADAADRLAEEAANGRGAHGGGGDRAASEATQEAHALVALVALLRDLVPEELRQQVADLVRQVLLLVRAVIDWYLARLEAPGPAPRPGGPIVEDIPLD